MMRSDEQLAPISGYYPTQKAQGGKFAWMDRSLVWAQPLEDYLYPGSVAEYSRGLAGVIDNAGRDPVKGGSIWGAAIEFPNAFQSGGNTAYGSQWDMARLLPGAAESTDEFTFAAIVGGATFADAVTERLVFWCGLRTDVKISIRMTTTPRLFFDVDDGASTSDRPLNKTEGLPGGAHHRIICRQTAEGMRSIWHNGTKVGEMDDPYPFTLSYDNFNGFFLAGGNKGEDAWHGSIGAAVFCIKAWTDAQCRAWSADAYGHHRPLFTPMFNRLVCMDASIGSRLVLSADFGAATVLAADLGADAVLAADLASGTALEVDLSAETVLAADLGAETVLEADTGSATVLEADPGSDTVLAADVGAATVLAADVDAATVLESDVDSETVLAADASTCKQEG